MIGKPSVRHPLSTSGSKWLVSANMPCVSYVWLINEQKRLNMSNNLLITVQ